MPAGFAPIARVMLAALALSLVATPPADAARSEFFGVVKGPVLDDTDADAIAAAGVKTSRFLLSWKSIEKRRGQRNWSATDELVGRLASRGIRGLPAVWGSPSWVRTGGTARPPINSGKAKQAWQDFLKAAVARYGRGGGYWTNGYRQQFGEGATPVPIRSWQVWNEPNLRPEFYPGETVAEAARTYGGLLGLSHDAIKSRDRQAQIVLAGIATQKDPRAFDFLDHLYSVPGVKADFDAAAQHPYAANVDKVRDSIQRVRKVMADNGDAETPLWITEFGWGSAPADGSGINLGPAGQARMLTRAYKLVLSYRRAWNVQRLYWFDWRDPPAGSHYGDICIRCGSAGLVTHERVPKPAFGAFTAFTAETNPPVASISLGPSEGSLINDPTPTFSLASSEAGSTFACRMDAGSFTPCSSPYTGPRLTQGAHTFSVKAIDAAGNESAIISRSFTLDSRPPAAPVITATVPGSPANANAPRVKGSATVPSTVRLYKTTGCTGVAAVVGSASKFASTGLEVPVADDTTNRLRATATDAAGNTSPCSAAQTYVEDSTAPETTISDGPSGSTSELFPIFSFTSSQPGSTFECRFDSEPFAACSGPDASHTPALPLLPGLHTFEVRATDAALNTDPTPASRTFTVTL
jgi:hypothetical protein